MRCSVAEKSRPSMRVWNLPAPPNSASMTENTRVGSHTIRPEPRKGRAAMMLKLVGTTIFAQEGAVLLHLDAAHRHLGRLADEVEQPDADVARKPLVDDLHRGHAPTHDPLLLREVVVAHAFRWRLFLLQLLAFARDALQEGIQLRLERIC